MKFNLNVEYVASFSADVDLPIKEWREVKEWFVKWNVLHYMLNGDTEYREIDLQDQMPDSSEMLDIKHPVKVYVREVD